MPYECTEDSNVDVLIVLGTALINNAPGVLLKSRLDAAIEYLRTRDNILTIVSGGLGRGDKITEAEAMLRYLVAHGVDEIRIWKEDASVDTRENLAFSKKLMIEKGVYTDNTKVAILSNGFHLFRAKIIAKKAGLDAIGVAAATPGLHRKVWHYLREAYALVKEMLVR